MSDTTVNPYLTMFDLDRVRQDPRYGVTLARIAFRARDPESADKEMGKVIQPGREQEQAERQGRILAATKDYLKNRRPNGRPRQTKLRRTKR
jgi:hypothetical protein